jgi:putative transposase
MSIERRRQMIEPEHAELSIVRQCELVSISRSGFYYQPAGETPLNLALMRLIDRQFLETPWYGSRQMARHLRREGYTVGRKRVRRLMAKMGLEPIYQRPRTTVPHPDHQIYPYLLREMVIERPNQVWCADITYIPMRCGFLYLVAVMDWARLLKVPSALPMEWQTRARARCCRGVSRTRWMRTSALRRWRRLWRGMVAPRSSTPTVRMTVSAISRRSRRDKATNCPRITDTARCPRSP